MSVNRCDARCTTQWLQKSLWFNQQGQISCRDTFCLMCFGICTVGRLLITKVMGNLVVVLILMWSVTFLTSFFALSGHTHLSYLNSFYRSCFLFSSLLPLVLPKFNQATVRVPSDVQQWLEDKAIVYYPLMTQRLSFVLCSCVHAFHIPDANIFFWLRGISRTTLQRFMKWVQKAITAKECVKMKLWKKRKFERQTFAERDGKQRRSYFCNSLRR